MLGGTLRHMHASIMASRPLSMLSTARENVEELGGESENLVVQGGSHLYPFMQFKPVGMVVKQMWCHAQCQTQSNDMAQKLTATSLQVARLVISTEMTKQC